MADIHKLYALRLEAASIALARGDRSEAERLYLEALAMGDEHFGATSPELAAPLNELSRLYVHLAAHARAEPLLERLLTIRRAEGENHPGVATVLSALAAVRRGLGDDARAEGLYRRALAIRELAHSPDHMSVVVALEHLAETCAARGKAADAITLLQRAVPGREKALGAEHATVRALHARMAELALEAGAANQLVFLYEPPKPVRRASVKRERSVTPPFSSMAVAAASIMAAPAQVAQSQPSAPMEVAAPTLALTSLMDVGTPVAPRVDAERAARDGVIEPLQRRNSAARPEWLEPPPKRDVRRYAYAAVGMSGLAGAIFFANAMASSESPASVALAAARPAAVVVPAVPASLPATSVAATTVAAMARPDSARVARLEPVNDAPLAVAPRPAPEAEKRVAMPSLPGALPVIGDVAVPLVAIANADSVLGESTKRRDTPADQLLPTAGRLKSRELADNRAETMPVLIGSVPQPRFPDALRSQRMEGAVVVQFLVGADGRVDVSTMKVVRSPHEQFTSAVRAVLPKFRFEPARTADAKPRAEWVQYSIEFSSAR